MNPDSGNVDDLLTEATALRKENQFEEAIEQIHKALELSRTLSDTESVARSLNELAQAEREMGDTAASIDHYRDLLEYERENSRPLGAAHALRHLGNIHQDEGRIDEAEECYSQALEIYRTNHGESKMALANTLRAFALLKNQQDKKQESLSLWKEARIIYEENHVKEGIKECNRWIRRLG